MEAVRRTLLKSRIRAELNKPKTNRKAAHAALVALSRWPNNHSNVHEVIGNILNRAQRAKATAETRKNASLKLMSLVNNATIVLDPLGHKPPANKYKGFMQRYGRYLNHSLKRTIVSKAPYKRTSNTNYAKRFPNKIERTTSQKQKPYEYLAQLFFPKGPRPNQYLGGGADGKVYTTNDGRIMKFMLGQARQEYTALRNLRNTGLVPSFRDGNGKVLPLTQFHRVMAKKLFGQTSPYMTAFVMGRAGGANSMTLRKYIQTHPADKENIAQRLRSAINTLGLKGISHGDMHQDNIIVEVDSTGRIRRMWLIDFGRSSRINIGQTARNMFAVTRALLVKRGQKPKLFPTTGLYGGALNVPLHGTKQNSRIDPHMFMALTGKEYSRENEARTRNKRLNLNKQNTQRLLAGVNNRPRVTSKPRARSATPARRPNSANRNTSNTPRGSPKSTRASPRRSPPRPRSGA
jgi:hypothetical protein